MNVFNTQVPAALGGRIARRKPYVAVTDVTPIQYDRMAEGYGHRPDSGGPLSRYKHHVNREIYGRALACVAWSTWAASSMEADYGVSPERITVIPPGVDLDPWRPRSRRPAGDVRVLFVGGDFARKGGDLLLEAVESLHDRVHLTLVTKSDVPMASPQVSIVDDLTPNDDRLRRMYADSHIFVLASRAEAFGIAAVEAAGSGLPSIVSDAGGLRDTVEHGSTGLVVPTADVRALTEALATLVDDEHLRSRMGRAARERAERHFDAAVNADRLLDLVRTAAAQ